MPQHHGRRENHGCGVGAVGTHDVLRDVTAAGLEESVFLGKGEAFSVPAREESSRKTYPANVATRDDTGTTDKGGTDVRDDGTVQVRHDHDIELARARDKLHGTRKMGERIEFSQQSGIVRVINDHVVELDSSGLVLFRDTAEGVQEQAITKLHDVGLVYASDFLMTRYG